MDANLRLAGLSIGMMQLDIVLPSQHFGPRRMHAPEQRLMIAVFHDALECVQKHRFAEDAAGQRLFDEAKEWFLADEAEWPYSFTSICAMLDFDVIAVRESLRCLIGTPPNDSAPAAEPPGRSSPPSLAR